MTLADQLFQRARACRAQGDRSGAVAAYRQAIAADPGIADAYNNLGVLLLEERAVGPAAACQVRALRLLPSYAEAHLNLANCLAAAGRPDGARHHVAAALRLRPGDAKGWNNLANLERAGFRLAEAEAALRRALALEPGFAQAWANLATVSGGLGRLEDGIRHGRRAVALEPHAAGFRYNLALVELAADDPAGWRDYAARWAAGVWAPRPFRQPRWNGEADGTLLAWGEQGIGDEIMFATRLPDHPALVVEADPRLVPLLARSFPEATVVGRADPPHPAALGAARQIAAGDLPGLGPPARPLRADVGRVAAYKRQIAGPERLRVGLSWRTTNAETGPLRTLPREALARLLATPGCAFHSLQYGETAEERGLPGLRRIDGLDLRDDLDGVAALMAALDLVVTIDNAAAHLAGALRVPVWTLLPAMPEWRWGWSGEATAWYPSMRLFRQDRLGDWGPVLDRVAAALAEVLACV